MTSSTITTAEGKIVCIYCTLEMMRRRGGGFVKVLTQLWWHGDPINKAKIEFTWQDYFKQYAEDVVETKLRCRH